MQVSKKKVNPNLKNQIYQLLYQVIADIRSKKEAEIFLNEGLTETELEIFAKRLGAAYYLNKGRSYANIKTNLRLSSATISSVAEQMKKGKGFETALQKINAEEWANKWAERISKRFKSLL
ncbi:hypothetical protein A2Z41_00740 [Microgenomates group bacterium RBG_19FT_COMBO_39_10]|nr:MAG: hypothetical protein A2Z41_00740 [Microgenomates group bacterium RBG_19FT_COMBO_39_10]